MGREDEENRRLQALQRLSFEMSLRVGYADAFGKELRGVQGILGQETGWGTVMFL